MNTTSDTSTAPVPGPARGALLTKEYVQAVGRMADIWRWPLSDGTQRKVACRQQPAALARRAGDVAPGQREVAGANQDLMDGFDIRLLDMEQAAQVQDFGEQFWVFPLYDGHSSLGCPANACGRPQGRL